MHYTAFQCAPNYITLQCPFQSSIFVTSAYYGQYRHECTQEDQLQCCPPNLVKDCMESMEDNEPVDWAALKVSCDNQSTCSFETRFATMSSCTEPYRANWTLVYYQCLPGCNKYYSEPLCCS